MGKLRDLKKATEAYWGEKISRDDLLKEAKRLRLEHWKIQKDAGVDIIPSGDFSLYDQVLDHIQLFGVCVMFSLSLSFFFFCMHFPSTWLTGLRLPSGHS